MGQKTRFGRISTVVLCDQVDNGIDYRIPGKWKEYMLSIGRRRLKLVLFHLLAVHRLIL